MFSRDERIGCRNVNIIYLHGSDNILIDALAYDEICH